MEIFLDALRKLVNNTKRFYDSRFDINPYKKSISADLLKLWTRNKNSLKPNATLRGLEQK